MTGNRTAHDTLASQLLELESRVARIKADLFEPMSADSEEQAVESEDDEALFGLETMVLQKIAAVRAAIKRVDEGRYGFCLTCGDAISQSRLATVPEAALCINCAAL